MDELRRTLRGTGLVESAGLIIAGAVIAGVITGRLHPVALIWLVILGYFAYMARGVIRQADRLDLWVDNLTNRPQRLEVLTSLEGEPVRLTATFARLPDGPTYAVETIVETELKEKKMVVRTEAFDHERRDD